MPRSYTHKTKSDKGKSHPDRIRPGVQTVKKLGGEAPKNGKGLSRGGSNQPAGVRKNSGTETRRGTEVKHLHTKNPMGTVKGSSIPADVAKHSGLSAPKRVK